MKISDYTKNPVINASCLVEHTLKKADDRGHGGGTKGAGVGGAIGGILGSFLGPAGSGALAMLGAYVGHKIGGQTDKTAS